MSELQKQQEELWAPSTEDTHGPVGQVWRLCSVSCREPEGGGQSLAQGVHTVAGGTSRLLQKLVMQVISTK